jgi:hypothetical protein
MQARQPMHRVLSWIIAFGFTVGVLIYGSFFVSQQIFWASIHHEALARPSRNQSKRRDLATKNAKVTEKNKYFFVFYAFFVVSPSDRRFAQATKIFKYSSTKFGEEIHYFFLPFVIFSSFV